MTYGQCSHNVISQLADRMEWAFVACQLQVHWICLPTVKPR